MQREDRQLRRSPGGFRRLRRVARTLRRGIGRMVGAWGGGGQKSKLKKLRALWKEFLRRDTEGGFDMGGW